MLCRKFNISVYYEDQHRHLCHFQTIIDVEWQLKK